MPLEVRFHQEHGVTQQVRKRGEDVGKFLNGQFCNSYGPDQGSHTDTQEAIKKLNGMKSATNKNAKFALVCQELNWLSKTRAHSFRSLFLLSGWGGTEVLADGSSVLLEQCANATHAWRGDQKVPFRSAP